MPKFVITYGLQGHTLQNDIITEQTFSDAFEEAQLRSLRLLEEVHPEVKAKVYSEYGYDKFLAYSYYVSEALPYLDFNVKDFKEGESIMYLVTNQLSIFDSTKFVPISVDKAIEILSEHKILGLDTETEGLDCHTKKLLLLQIGNKEFQINFDISSYEGKIPEKVKDFLNSYEGLFILQNAKFDLKFLFKQDVVIKKVYDTMLAEIILTNGLQYDGRDLKTIVEKYCGVSLDKSVRGEIIAKGITDRVLEYGSNDVKYLLEVREKQLQEITKLKLNTAVDLDNSFVFVLAYTEYCGIKLDYDKWSIKVNKNIEKVSELKNTLEKQLWEDGKLKYFSGMVDMFSGSQTCTINWNSPKQIIALFEDYGINVEVHDKGVTKKSVNAAVLKPQVKKFSILKPYLEYKEAQKEVSTYGYNWKGYINKETGRIHTTYQQLMDTGRLSSGNKYDGTPNMQNLPADEETRSCFIAEKGNVLIDADYSSQEQIILANFSKEENLLNFYKKGFTDMHSYIAFLIYKDIRRCSLEELTPDKLAYLKQEYPNERTKAKSAGFAINYGGNGSTIANNLGIPKSEGDFVYNAYFEAFPNLKEYFELVFARADHYGYIQYNPITKRKYFFNKEINHYFINKDKVNDKFFWYTDPNPRETIKKYNEAKSEIARLAQNYPIQGSAADMTKYAGILFMREILKNGWWLKVKIVNFVHDEILVECPEEISEEVRDLLVTCMKEAANPFCRVLPLNADALIGEHWLH